MEGGVAVRHGQFLGPLIIEPGIRFEHHSYVGDSTWSPRLNASLELGLARNPGGLGSSTSRRRDSQELSVADGDTAFHPAERAETTGGWRDA